MFLDQSADVVVIVHADRMTATAGPILRNTGWRGGWWVRYVPPTGVDEFVVERSDGNAATGFLLFPSENYADPSGASNNYTAEQLRDAQGAISGASTVTILAGGGRQLFRIFETVALTGGGTRTGGAIVYQHNDILRVSENGLLCNDSVANLQAAGIANPLTVGTCCMVPADRNGDLLGMDLKF